MYSKKKQFFFISDLTHAATKIQACFRGHVERKKIHKDDDKKDEDIDIDEITKKVYDFFVWKKTRIFILKNHFCQVAEELDIDLDDPELNKAATKIQATFRGHKTRKDAPATEENWTSPPS